MKKYIIYSVLFTALLLTGCEDRITEIFTGNSPVYMSYEDLRQTIKQSDARELDNPGKLYFKDNYIFIVEEMKGIHIIDNADPANPQNISFIEIPGVADMAVKGTILYTDSYIDLVAMDISDLSAIHEVGRVEDMLPYTIPQYDEDYPVAMIDEEQGVVVDWEIKKIKQQRENRNYPVYRGGWEVMTDVGGGKVSGGGISAGGVGVGGSMARFGIAENTLYAIDNTTLHIFSITDPEEPVFKKDFSAGWGIETLFILDKHMFLGSQNGMRVYDISVPNSPMYVSDFWHATGCDPVVVQGDLAYITLRGGNACGNEVNQLIVVSIRNIAEPEELKAYPMEGPYGLGIDDKTLFVCDGEAGLKVFDVTDPLSITDKQLAIFPDIFGYDVIPIDGVLMLIGDDGLYQYDYSDVTDIRLLSKIEIGD